MTKIKNLHDLRIKLEKNRISRLAKNRISYWGKTLGRSLLVKIRNRSIGVWREKLEATAPKDIKKIAIASIVKNI